MRDEGLTSVDRTCARPLPPGSPMRPARPRRPPARSRRIQVGPGVARPGWILRLRAG